MPLQAEEEKRCSQGECSGEKKRKIAGVVEGALEVCKQPCKFGRSHLPRHQMRILPPGRGRRLPAGKRTDGNQRMADNEQGEMEPGKK